jgi:4-amino-4-deoxy-L-arabinose transferase-like glycosyltransferase
VLAAIGTAVSAFPVMIGHALLTSALDVPLTLLALLFAARALRRGNPRWWAAAGVVIGVALYNKLLVVLVAAAVLIGLLVAGPRAELRKPWLWGGAAIAVLLAAPNLIFQVSHGWPAVDVASALSEHKGAENRITLLPFQLILLGPVLVPVMIAGMIGLLRDPGWRPLRAFGVAYLVAAAAVLATGGRPDYLVPLLLLLLAAGSARLDGWISRQPGRIRLLAAGLAVNGLVTAVIALPLVPIGVLGSTPVPAINQLARDSVGWPQLADQVATVYRSLPEPERANTVVVTGNYGEAGGIQRFGPPDLAVYSGQNELHRAGPPPESAHTAILVGLGGATRLFTTCTKMAEIDNTFGVDNEEQARPIHLCRDPREPWRDLWPRFLHYD